jgi:hypothetical protein
MKKYSVYYFAVLFFLVACSTSQQQPLIPLKATSVNRAKTINIFANPKATSLSKISPFFDETIKKLREEGVTNENAIFSKPTRFSSHRIRVNDAGKIQAYIYVNNFNEETRKQLEALGIEIKRVLIKYGIVNAWIPYNKFEETAALEFIKRISNPSYPVASSGSITTQGDSILRSANLRNAGITGAGVKVGVISDGSKDMATSQATGDLPTDIYVTGNLGTWSSRNNNEGTAMMEIVHDIAPGASLGMGQVEADSTDFIECLANLKNIFGATIVVDDLFFFDEPYFEDGIVAQAVASNLDDNFIYVSAAGNFANKHYEKAFQGTSGLGMTVHDFGGAGGGATDIYFDMEIPAKSGIALYLQWNDKFGQSSNDYNLHVYDGINNSLITESAIIQDGTNDPTENTEGIYNINDANYPVRVVVSKASGEDKIIEMIAVNAIITDDSYIVRDGSVAGHSAVSGVISTGAISATDLNHDTIEYFSSRGNSEIYFPSYESRPKPDITGIDRVSVTGAGGFPTTFGGTSAAAPHIAGIMALLKEKYPLKTSQELKDALFNSAVDLGTAGFDTVFGYGRADALAAAQYYDNPPESNIELPAQDVTTNTGQSLNFAGSCNDPDAGTIFSYLWTFGDNSSVPGSIVQSPGATVFPVPGTFTITLTCVDELALADPTPASRVVTVTAASSGGCFMDVRTGSHHSSGLPTTLFFCFLLLFLKAKARKFYC